MSNCLKCGATLPEYSGDLCANCQAAQGSGAAGDVPCQRCGMYLPSHELQMWNSRLYCAYCIMDIKDEEERHRKFAERHEQPVGREAGAGAAGGISSEMGRSTGICERCGRGADQLYTLSGRRVCERCYTDESGSAPAGTGPTFFAQIVARAARIFKTEKPRVLVAQPVKGRGLVFDVETRKMVEKKAGGKPVEEKKP